MTYTHTAKTCKDHTCNRQILTYSSARISFVAATLALQLFLTPVIRFCRRRKIGQWPILAWRFAKHKAGVAHTSSNQRHTLIQSLVIEESWKEASQISSPFLIGVHCLLSNLAYCIKTALLYCLQTWYSTNTVPPGARMKLILWDSGKTSRRNDRAPCLYMLVPCILCVQWNIAPRLSLFKPVDPHIRLSWRPVLPVRDTGQGERPRLKGGAETEENAFSLMRQNLVFFAKRCLWNRRVCSLDGTKGTTESTYTCLLSEHLFRRVRLPKCGGWISVLINRSALWSPTGKMIPHMLTLKSASSIFVCIYMYIL